jgi:hypothetical protein
VHGQTGYRYRERRKESDSVSKLLGGTGPKHLWETKVKESVSMRKRCKIYFSRGNRVVNSLIVKAL